MLYFEKEESIFSTECFLLIRILRPNDVSSFSKKFTTISELSFCGDTYFL